MKKTSITLILNLVIGITILFVVVCYMAFATCSSMNGDPSMRCNSNLVGMIHINLSIVPYEDMSTNFFWLSNGGQYFSDSSTGHTPHERIAILIPFRKREKHLQILLNNLHPFLYKQQIGYTIYVIEQVDEKPFNKGKLYNIGYLEAKKNNYTCYVFHDVDLIPVNDHNVYGCVRSPMHLSRAIDKFNYRLPDDKLIGGVSAWRSKEFEKVNGWSNLFMFWGGEDDDMSYRIIANGLSIFRYRNSEIGRYVMLRHKQATVNTARHQMLQDSHTRYKFDGLSSLLYIPPKIEQKSLYTKLLVQV